MSGRQYYTDDGTRHESSFGSGSLSDGQSDFSARITAEQSERLLGEHSLGTDDGDSSNDIPLKEYGDLGGVRPRPRREAWWRTCLFFFAVLASMLSLLFLVKIAFFDGAAVRSEQAEEAVVTSAAPVPEVATTTTAAAVMTTTTPATQETETPSFRRPESDYILDRRWDFSAPPTVREYNWVVQNIEANPDGVFRTLITINGQFPGELIRCNEGDTIVVNVENKAVNATAIHWHGLFQNGTNHMDGTPGATQCPIAPGRSFRYEFTVKGQSGTCK